MNVDITEMTMADYDESVLLWQEAEGIGLHDDSDSRGGIAAYLQRNGGMSFVARDSGGLVGAVLCGTDGRRGYLHHLAVAKAHRKQGVGRRLVERSLLALGAIGITKCHIFVYPDNTAGQAFWKRLDWFERTDLMVMSKNLERNST